MKLHTIVMFASTLVTTVALAQAPSNPTNPDIDSHATKLPSGMLTDAKFMKTFAVGGMAEVEAGKLATTKAMSSDVKKFAQTMVNDHSKNNEQLKTLATKKQVELPASADKEHAAALTKLEQQSGATFDAEYMQAQVKDHQKTVELLQNEIDNGQDTNVKAFAQETLPVVRHHLEMAKELNSKVAHDKH